MPPREVGDTPRATETPEQRKARVRSWVGNREKCRRCGYLLINVRHEPDPANAPEGPGYYRDAVPDLHEFIPSGEFEGCPGE